MGPKYIGPYQRPAPPKKPNRLNQPKTVQKPPISMHEVEIQARTLMENIPARRKPGRPSIHPSRPMTPAERQARRRDRQSREREAQLQDQAIQEARQIGAAHGKSHAEADSGGYDSRQIEKLIGGRYYDEEIGQGRSGRVCPGGADSEDGESARGIHVHGLQVGSQKSNHARFAEDELKKMVQEYFSFPEVKTSSACWIAKHSGNNSVQLRERPSITLTCKLCAEKMEFIEDAQDHLRVDHKDFIKAWFKKLTPRREFRDMGNYVTIAEPKKRVNHRTT